MHASSSTERLEISRQPVRQRRLPRIRGRLTPIMGLFGVAFIVITFGYIAWEQRGRQIQRNMEDVRSNAFFLADHTARFLEATDLTLKQTQAVIEGQGWDEIEASKPLWQQLRAVKQALPYVDNIWLNDAGGRLRLTSTHFPTPPSNAAGHDAFNAQIEADQGLFVGEPVIGRVAKAPTFIISRRLEGPNGTFGGIVAVTMTLSYFNDYWEKLRLPKGSRITLLRSGDGAVIAQHPSPPDGLSFLPIDKAAFDRALASDARSGAYSPISMGDEQVGAYHRIGELPLYISVSMPANAYWGPWIVQMRLYGAFALIALLALLALTALAAQQVQEQTADAAVLERQVAARTAELETETAALEILNRIGSALAGKLDLGRIVQNVVDGGVELAGAQIGAFFHNIAVDLREQRVSDRKDFELYALSGMSRDALKDPPRLQSTKIFTPTFTEGRAVRSDDITSDPAYGDATPHKGMPPGHFPVRSYMAVPVLSRMGEIYGVLLFGHEKPGIFTERAERLVTGLAAQAAIAIENGRLYQDAQHEIEERKQAQAQQSLLIRELHHRVKNTLATVQAVVGATARSTSNIDEFYKAFVGRIISLANTHSLLTEAVWQTASLREILEKELSPYKDDKGERVAIKGPVVELPSEAAVPIGMAIHELTTNAAKYGALADSSGRVAVAWTSQPDPAGTRLRLVWHEQGGPSVAPPQKQGFGSRLLHRVLTTQLNADVNMEFQPEGLRVSIEAVLKPGAFLDPVV